jgi:phosphate acetyltransferase
MEDAKAKIIQPHYFGGMMVEKGLANGMICGIHSQTKPYGPAFEIIKTVEGVTKASGLFFMEDTRSQKLLLLADCALNMKPTAEELAQIIQNCSEFWNKTKVQPLLDAWQSKHLLMLFLKQPLLSKLQIRFNYQGNQQCIIRSGTKSPDSKLKGGRLVFSLNSEIFLTNFAKTVDILHWACYAELNKPINDISRGASAEDVVLCTYDSRTVDFEIGRSIKSFTKIVFGQLPIY